MINRDEIAYVKRAVKAMQITPPNIKPIIANYLIKRARVFDLNFDEVLKDLESVAFHLKEITFNESKEFGKEKTSITASYYPRDLAIRFYIDHLQEITPSMLYQTMAHEVNHTLNKGGEHKNGQYVPKGDNWVSYDPKTGEYYGNFHELIVERASAMTVFSDSKRNNLYYSNNYDGYFNSGPCLEMAMAAFGVGEYNFLKHGIKSKKELKKYIADNTPFTYEEINNVFNSFEHFYNLSHNAQYGSKDPSQESNNKRREDIASGMIGMMNVSENHIQEDIMRRDLLNDPNAVELLALRQNQLRISFETCFNTSLWMYGAIPDSNIRVYNETVEGVKETSKKIHYLQQFMRNRKIIERVAGDRFPEVIDALKTGDLHSAYAILATYDKRLNIERIEKSGNPDEMERAIVSDFRAYGITPLNNNYLLSINPKVVDMYVKENQPPKMPLSQRIADIIAETALYSHFNQKSAELGYKKRSFWDIPIIKVLRNRTTKFPQFPVEYSYNEHTSFSFSRYIELDSMTPKQKNDYLLRGLNSFQFQTPELKGAFLRIIYERILHNNISIIQAEGEIDQLYRRVTSIEYTKEPPKYAIDKDKMVYYQDGKLLINEEKVAQTNDPEILFQELSGVVNCLMDMFHNDYKLDENGYILRNGYYEYMNGLYGKYEYIKNHKKSLARITPVEEKLFFIPEMLVRVMGESYKTHLFDYIDVARKGEKHLRNYTFNPFYRKNLINTDTFIEGVDLLYKTLNYPQLSEKDKSEKLIRGCDLLFEATEMYSNYTVANYVNRRSKTMDDFFEMQGLLVNNVEVMAENSPPGSPLAEYANGIYNRIIKNNEGVLYLDKLIESGKMNLQLDRAVYAWHTGGSTDFFQSTFEIEKSMQAAISDKDISWKICIIALTGDRSKKAIDELKNMSSEEIESKAKALLTEKGISLPNANELKDRMKKAYLRPATTKKPGLGFYGKLNAPLEANLNNENNAFKKVDSVVRNLFEAVKRHFHQDAFNLDGRGDPHHPTQLTPSEKEEAQDSDERTIQDATREEE